jgi:hypothetical protein
MKFKCEQVEQFTVFLENRPGVLAELCTQLSKRGVNLRAISTVDNRDTASVRLVADDPEATRAVLAEMKIAFAKCSCLALRMPNTAGGFAAIAHKLAMGGINIDYIYASAVPGPGPALGILGVSDMERALVLDWEDQDEST